MRGGEGGGKQTAPPTTNIKHAHKQLDENSNNEE